MSHSVEGKSQNNSNNVFHALGFTCVFFTLDKTALIINKCEERLIKVGTRMSPFSVDEIRRGALKGQLIASDYTAPMEVTRDFDNFLNWQVTRTS